MKLSVLICAPYIVLAGIFMLLIPVPIYLSLFLTIILFIILAYALTFIKEKNNKQIQVLSNLVDALIDGDYSLRGKKQDDPAVTSLLNKINELASLMHKKILRAEEGQRLLEKILNQMNALIFVVNNDGNLLMANNSARAILFPSTKVSTLKSDIETHHLHLTHRPLLKDTPLGFLEDRPGSSVVCINENSLKGEFFLFRDNIVSDGEKQNLFLLTSTENLLKEKEAQAWQSLLRVLSHEVNNSLTPISTISRSMKRKLADGAALDNQTYFEEGLTIIDERSSSLASFISSYRELMYLPPPQKTHLVVDALVAKVTPLFKTCHFEFSPRYLENCQKIQLFVDEKQLWQVLINLVKNAIEASTEQSGQSASNEPRQPGAIVQFDLHPHEDSVDIYLQDNGVGITNLKDLFIPMYTTKKQGSGIGLSLSQQIIQNHQGNLILRNRKSQPGAEAIISLPCTLE